MLERALPLIAGAVLNGCVEYNFKPNENGSDTGSSGESDSGAPEEDTAPEDSGAEDSGGEIPTYPISEAIVACLNLTTGACQFNLDERGVDSACTARETSEANEIEANIVAAAQEATGNSALTIEDIEEDRVAGTVWAYSSLGYSTYNGEPVAQKLGFLHVSFDPNAAAAFADIFTPYDTLPVTSLRCGAEAYSYDTETPLEDVIFENERVETSVKLADESASSGSLNIIDFSFGGESDVIKIHNHDEDLTDPNLVFTSTYNALNADGPEVIRTAFNYTGTPTGTDSVIVSY